MPTKVSAKHLQIDKTKSTILAVVAVAILVTIFSLFATKALISKGLYQRRAIKEKKDVAQTLKSNVDAAHKLVNQYQDFQQQDPNVLGGSVSGKGNQDGDNARIALDALPSKYDAPALASSLEKLMGGRNVTIRGIDVKDDPAGNPDDSQAIPELTTMPFSFEGATSFKNAKNIISDFEHSIRPFDITSLELTGTDEALRLTVSGNTYFQPAKSLSLDTMKEVE